MAAVATMPGLRPLAFGEILDVGIKLCLRNWRVLVMCVVWLVLPAQIISVSVLLSGRPDALDPTRHPARSSPARRRASSSRRASAGSCRALVYLVSTAACFKAVADAYLGHRAERGPLAARSGCGACRG